MLNKLDNIARMELRDLIKYTPWYYYEKAFKSLVEIVGNKKFIRFAILGVQNSGKTHFMRIVRKEPYDPDKQTPFTGDTIEKKEVKLNGKTLVFERTRDISGHNLSEYPELIARADIVYFFFRADSYLNDSSLANMKEEGFTKEDIQTYKTYRQIVFGHFGSIIRDKNAKDKPIKIVATYRSRIKSINDNTLKSAIRNGFYSAFPDVDFSNCAWFVADIDDSHRDWVEDNAKELIFNM